MTDLFIVNLHTASCLFVCLVLVLQMTELDYYSVVFHQNEPSQELTLLSGFFGGPNTSIIAQIFY